MKVPSTLATAFDQPFQKLIADFAAEFGLLPDPESIVSDRFLSRSVVPHIKKLSTLFNRIPEEPEESEEKDAPLRRPPRQTLRQGEGLAPYWKESSNPEHLRLAYFLYFMPSNLYRVASVWSELSRLGYRWKGGDVLRAIEFGSGPATGACGIAAGEKHAPSGLPASGSWALIEQDKGVLELGRSWAERYFADQGYPEWSTRPFHRKLSLKDGLLPRAAPRFNLWLMSYFLNEYSESPAEIAERLLMDWERHLEREGLAILVEPALKLQSRRLLEIRKEILKAKEGGRYSEFQILLPCLGHQACGALANPEDWCHEEVSWWRPPYFRILDKMAGLDRKTLPFSYLVVARSKRPLQEILPILQGAQRTHRLVSPSHSEGKEREFFVCGTEGKRKARLRPRNSEDPATGINRGDILTDAEIRGDTNASRVTDYKKIL